jgi:hypothetical protein
LLRFAKACWPTESMRSGTYAVTATSPPAGNAKVTASLTAVRPGAMVTESSPPKVTSAFVPASTVPARRERAR